MASYFQAIRNLRPEASFGIIDDDLSQIDWRDEDFDQPTNDEIEVEFQRLIAEEPWLKLRSERDRLLAETDWTVSRAIDKSNDGFGIQLEQVWVDYRQALRDLPANTTDPENPVWPVKPAG